MINNKTRSINSIKEHLCIIAGVFNSLIIFQNDTVAFSSCDLFNDCILKPNKTMICQIEGNIRGNH